MAIYLDAAKQDSFRVGQVHDLTRVIQRALDGLMLHLRHAADVDEAAALRSQVRGLVEKFSVIEALAADCEEQLARDADRVWVAKWGLR